MTPVHHIIGKSGGVVGFWGPPMPSALENRDAWLTLLWEPTSMLKLAQTHRHIYTLDWGRLPERAILAGLAIKIRKAGVARDEQELRRLNLKRDRARADLKQISIIGRAVNDAPRRWARPEVRWGHGKSQRGAQPAARQRQAVQHQGGDPDPDRGLVAATAPRMGQRTPRWHFFAPGANSAAAAGETLSGNVTLNDNDVFILRYNPNGSNRTIKDRASHRKHRGRILQNSGSSGNLMLTDKADNAIATVAPASRSCTAVRA